jgi:hypothetical protein
MSARLGAPVVMYKRSRGRDVWIEERGSGSLEDPPDRGEAFGDDGPPDPAPAFLAGNQARLREDPGVVGDRGLAPL